MIRSSFFKNRWVIFLLLASLFMAYRIIIIESIHIQRELPIEVDDAYAYISQAFLLYKDKERVGKTIVSARSILEKNVNTDLDNHEKLLRYYWFTSKTKYLLHSLMFGYATEILEFDPISFWWLKVYITQFLIMISILLMLSLYIKNNEKIILIVSLFFCSFISIEISHQIMATPFTIANSLLLIGWWIINQKIRVSWYIKLLGASLIILSLHMHPGAFVVIGLLALSSLILWKFLNDENQIIIFFISVVSVLVTLGFEYFIANWLNGNYYLSLFGLEKFKHDVDSLPFFKLISYNFRETIGRFINFTSLYSTNVFGVGFVIYVGALSLVYVKNIKLFVVNIVFLFGTLIGLIHYVPYHKGELIEYVGQSQLIFMSIAFSYLYVELFYVFFKKKKNVYTLLFLFSFFLLFLFNKYQESVKQIDIRSSRHNFHLNATDIKAFSNKLPENKSLIIGDEFVYAMLLSQVTNRSIVFADHMLKNGKWLMPIDIPEPYGYIGKPIENVSVGGAVYKLYNISCHGDIIFSNVVKLSNKESIAN